MVHGHLEQMEDNYMNSSTQALVMSSGFLSEDDEDDDDEEKVSTTTGEEEEEEVDKEAQQKLRKKNKVKFWFTATFMTVGSVCFSAFLFLIPFQIDPAISAILADFHPEHSLCSVVSAEVFVGISSCAWSSCSEGCTRDLYKCFQIRVNYTTNTASQQQQQILSGFLFVNVRGCGYPPEVSCETFYLSLIHI